MTAPTQAELEKIGEALDAANGDLCRPTKTHLERRRRQVLAAWRVIEPLVRRQCMDCQPCTAENPNESAYERGKFDGVMQFAAAIREEK
jgi:Pyruvate/2-oxoacid:ferredoxin oxidoreductase delta subunit